ncbi:hypothetical protein [Mesorhizobium sp. L-2-11]|uniref:hypothetical protein n=1 Tax=Mesorhizobium sp. L-2-11 TaxID=2744521 RepID=UPI00192643F1|nr:hypothetical protein [Mesorhizobium sp. L-2-11]BCH20211.1 hypothetical protein MesoLjLa_70620 [Mesorhizobium sp. L-2-11]
MDNGSLMDPVSYITYDAPSNENRTPWTIKVGQTVRMIEPKHRLIQAIREAGYETPTDAWRANRHKLGISQDLMISNTNGNRDISKKAAEKYARVFGRTAGWYLYGDNGEASAATDGASTAAAPGLVSQLAEVFADLVKAPPETQSRALKLLHKTVYGQVGSRSREMSTKQSS